MAKAQLVKNPLVPMAPVAEKCERGRGGKLTATAWNECRERFVIPEVPWSTTFRLSKTLSKGDPLITSSFAEVAAARCEGRHPEDDLTPNIDREGVNSPDKPCSSEARCSELVFIGSKKSAETGLPMGPAVRLCPRPFSPGPLVPVFDWVDSERVTRDYCERKVVPKGAPVAGLRRGR